MASFTRTLIFRTSPAKPLATPVEIVISLAPLNHATLPREKNPISKKMLRFTAKPGSGAVVNFVHSCGVSVAHVNADSVITTSAVAEDNNTLPGDEPSAEAIPVFYGYASRSNKGIEISETTIQGGQLFPGKGLNLATLAETTVWLIYTDPVSKATRVERLS